MWWLFNLLQRQRNIENKLDELIKTSCKHEEISSFKINTRSKNNAGYDIIKITYCENCRKHLNKEVVDFVPYKDYHVN